jgi:hypothetical protein
MTDAVAVFFQNSGNSGYFFASEFKNESENGLSSVEMLSSKSLNLQHTETIMAQHFQIKV